MGFVLNGICKDTQNPGLSFSRPEASLVRRNLAKVGRSRISQIKSNNPDGVTKWLINKVNAKI